MPDPVDLKIGTLLGTDGWYSTTPYIPANEPWIRIVDMRLRPRLFLRCHTLHDTVLFREVGHA